MGCFSVEPSSHQDSSQCQLLCEKYTCAPHEELVSAGHHCLTLGTGAGGGERYMYLIGLTQETTIKTFHHDTETLTLMNYMYM